MQKRAHREHKPGVMENVERARKATLVFCISCRQRELKCKTAKAALALPRDALQGQRAPKLVLQKATLPTGTPEAQLRASPDPYTSVCQSNCRRVGSQAGNTSEMGERQGQGHLSLTIAATWDEGLQNPWDEASGRWRW